jgi:uncharacterized repeat protein (TIGR01451 family)/uncharacterized delta-60 repeat protein
MPAAPGNDTPAVAIADPGPALAAKPSATSRQRADAKVHAAAPARCGRGGRVALAWLLLAFAGVPGHDAVAQSAVDGFTSPVTGGVVRVIDTSWDKILIGGEFTLEGGTRRLAQLHPDGSRDTSFNFDFAPPTGAVSAILPRAYDYLVGGDFAGAGYPSHLARVGDDGQLFTAFDLNLNGAVRALDYAVGGGYYIGGEFTAVNGVGRHRVARLTSDLTLDTTFTPPLFNGTITAVKSLSNGKVLVGGFLLGIPGNAGAGWALFRLNANGSLDTGFVFDSTPQGLDQVQSIEVQADGKVLIAGDFIATQAGQSRRRVARLEVNGDLDFSFTPPTLNGAVNRMKLQNDGRIVIVGAFTGVGLASRIARLNHDGSVDNGFSLLMEPDNFVVALALQSDGGVLFGGAFTQVTAAAASRIARIPATGGLDATFDPGGSTDGRVRAVAPLANGDLVVGGSFNTLAGQARSYLARFTGGNGALSSGFTPTLNGAVNAILVQRDGKFVVGGAFTLVNGLQRRRLVRFNADGSVDTGFVPAAIPDGIVHALELAPDDKIYIGGSFASVGGAGRAHFARLNPNGSLDTSFSDTLVDDTVHAIAMEWDQYRVYIGGEFDTVGAFARAGVARIWPHGAINNGFSGRIGGGLRVVYGLAPTPEGGVIVAGDFDSAGASSQFSRHNIARFLQDGNLDFDFDAGGASDGVNGTILTVLRRLDGKVDIGGTFTTVLGSTRQRFARLRDDGTVDPDLNVPVTVLAGVGLVDSLTALADGRMVLAGQFQAVAGTARPNIARIGNRGGIPYEYIGGTTSTARTWFRFYDAPPLRGAPELLVSQTCCSAASFEPLPGQMVWVDDRWTYENFPSLTGTWYLRARGRIGDGHGAGLIHSPIVQYRGGPPPTVVANLRIVKTVAPAQAPVGATVTFQLAAANLGPSAATGVTIQDLLPAGYTYLSHGNVQGSYVPATGVWTLGNLSASGGGSQATLSIQARIEPQGPYLNTASIAGNELDVQPSNNVSSVAVSVLEPPDDTLFANGFQNP